MRGDRYPQRFDFGWPPLWLELLGWLLVVLLIAALVGLIVWAITRSTGRRGAPSAFGPSRPSGAWSPEWSRQGPDQALQAARLRYAQGEISRDDYARLVADLGGQVPAAAGPPRSSQAPPGPPPGQPPAAPPPATEPPTQQV
jgi:hypothetical protein